MKPTVILQISDTHFGTEQPQVVDAVVALCASQQPDVLVLSGDITQRARRTQFAAAARFVARLQAPHKLSIPGNHDIPLFNLFARLMRPYAGYQAAFGKELEPVIDLADVLVIGVNTTRPARHKNGAVSPAQIARVSKQLAAASPRQLRLVVTHQPVHVVTAEDRGNQLIGWSEALQAWAMAGADLILGGHIHLPYVRLINEHVPLSRALWSVQAGTAVSSRVRGGIPNSVNLIRYQPSPQRSCGIERWDYEADQGNFQRIRTTSATLGS